VRLERPPSRRCLWAQPRGRHRSIGLGREVERMPAAGPGPLRRVFPPAPREGRCAKGARRSTQSRRSRPGDRRSSSARCPRILPGRADPGPRPSSLPAPRPPAKARRTTIAPRRSCLSMARPPRRNSHPRAANTDGPPRSASPTLNGSRGDVNPARTAVPNLDKAPRRAICWSGKPNALLSGEPSCRPTSAEDSWPPWSCWPWGRSSGPARPRRPPCRSALLRRRFAFPAWTGRRTRWTIFRRPACW